MVLGVWYDSYSLSLRESFYLLERVTFSRVWDYFKARRTHEVLECARTGVSEVAEPAIAMCAKWP